MKTNKSYLLSQGIYSWLTLQLLDHHHQDCYPHGHQQLQTDPVGSETEVWKFKTIMWEFCSCTLLLARQCPSHFNQTLMIYIVWLRSLCPVWSQRFSFATKREERRGRKKWWEKTSGSRRCESHYHATIGVNQHHEINEKATNNSTPAS